MIPKQIFEYHNSWVNLTPEEVVNKWDMPLYHMLPYQHFITLLQTNSLHFVNVMNSWGNEPYELFYIRPQYKLSSADLSLDDHKSRYFAQCWSTDKDSDAMWRIYSGPNKDGVTICTTLGKIIQLLYPPKKLDFLPYIGRVKYHSKEEIQQWVRANSHLSFRDWQTNLRESLFVKRDNFVHEQEFRILLTESSQDENNRFRPVSSYLSIPINPMTFIDEITLSPFISDAIENKQRQEINKYMGSAVIINKSFLYTNDISNYIITIDK